MNPGTSANGVPVDHFSHALHMHQQTQGREHWPQMLPQNQNQQFHPPTWQQSQPVHLSSTPQMLPQTYTNTPQYFQNPTPPAPAVDFSSIVPQQIMQDFLRLSTPVGSSTNDDTILAQALHESRQTGKTYRQALDGLHGVNNHAANLWKDYYLDHHDRFDLLVSRLTEQPKTVKKPLLPGKSPSRVKDVVVNEPPSTSSQVARKRRLSPPQRQIPKKKADTTVSRQKRPTPLVTTSALTRPLKRPRATLNSLSAPLPSGDVPNLMPPQADIPLPDPPSRSPTPPVVVQMGSSGNKYTKEDREYFLKFLVWRLKQDPSLTKKELCEQLHDKAPHHTATSWASHWHQRHDIADKILATYHGNSETSPENDEDQQIEEEEVEVEVGVKNDDDDARSDAMSAAEHSRDHSRYRIQAFSDFDDPDGDTEEDEDDMGEPGASFTRGDWCTLARFIARNRWDEMSRKERWQTFTENHGTKRSDKAWAEFFRKNEAGILKLSKHYLPGSRRVKKSRRGLPPRRNRQELSLDEDGECETDNEDN